MLQVAALPSPDEAQSAALDQELLAMKAVIDELQQRLQAEGYDVSKFEHQPAKPSAAVKTAIIQATAEEAAVLQPAQAEALADALPDGVLSTKHVSQNGIDTQHLMASMINATTANAGKAMLGGADGTLAEIDAVMQARGYR